ncbi:flagellar protein FlaG [Paenibacillus sp. L3-i20]|uniref:flagellar protein FlaG n=1 Tax=Paenibacillus sp. L3-i20 TaxID=2905833 RepID=UPI001EDCB5A9|nr:flagellar protein FlaG [Paenibacillus sp. L3-i20]GKU76819.1 flagellar protein FlaG [Paenibacillus sp. L3-i20]
MMNISSVNTTTGYLTDRDTNIGSRTESPVDNKNKKAINDSLDRPQLKRSLERILQAIQGPETSVERSIHKETNQVVYKIKDKTSGEVIRQFPEEKLLDAAARLIELTGMIIDEKV